MNDVSSRSHAIFTVYLEIMEWKVQRGGGRRLSHCYIYYVYMRTLDSHDIAGCRHSMELGKTGTWALGQQMTSMLAVREK